MIRKFRQVSHLFFLLNLSRTHFYFIHQLTDEGGNIDWSGCPANNKKVDIAALAFFIVEFVSNLIRNVMKFTIIVYELCKLCESDTMSIPSDFPIFYYYFY
ncbi:MAG: hypothetical protein EZS28_050316 [Streblomastix strix]|uniref:Uncharacterized protein n=1 Tax=Streblomastix strix TaxID=222440 RepID=A0A5J4T7H9_9EUKA|nr:MAG: hypothetical protein EZS28_050316 [Streblomastix strix]